MTLRYTVRNKQGKLTVLWTQVTGKYGDILKYSRDTMNTALEAGLSVTIEKCDKHGQTKCRKQWRAHRFSIAGIKAIS